MPSSITALLSTDPEPSPELCALVIAREFIPTLDVDTELSRITELTGSLSSRTSSRSPLRTQALALADHVYSTLGFHGDDQDYYSPDNSLLPRVIDRRAGIPLTLAVVLGAIGTRAGLTVENIGFPGHFLVRLGGHGGLYLDPFFAGRVLDLDALTALWRRFRGDTLQLAPEALEPIGAKALSTRMLLNLKNSWEQRQDHLNAFLTCDRLVELTASPEALRDRGLHAFALRAFTSAVRDLDAYLRLRPEAKDTPRVERVAQAARKHGSSACN